MQGFPRQHIKVEFGKSRRMTVNTGAIMRHPYMRHSLAVFLNKRSDRIGRAPCSLRSGCIMPAFTGIVSMKGITIKVLKINGKMRKTFPVKCLRQLGDKSFLRSGHGFFISMVKSGRNLPQQLLLCQIIISVLMTAPFHKDAFSAGLLFLRQKTRPL